MATSADNKLAELQNIDFTEADDFLAWTKKVMSLQRALAAEIEAGRQLLRGVLEQTPTMEGRQGGNLVGSRRAAKTVWAKLGRAAKSTIFAASQVGSAYKSFERDYINAMEVQNQRYRGMNVPQRGHNGHFGGVPGSTHTQVPTP